MLKYFFILSFILFIACEGPTGPSGKDGINGINGINGNDGDYDKQIRLIFNGYGTNSTYSWVLIPERGNIVKFNKSFFIGVDSIIFCATLRVQNGNGSAPAEARLFNITDNIEISNSIVSSSSSELTWDESANVINSLPNKEITLGIQVRMSGSYGTAEVNTPMLILYRK